MVRTLSSAHASSAAPQAATRVVRDMLTTGDPGYNRATTALQPVNPGYWPTSDPLDTATTPTAHFGAFIGPWKEVVSIRPVDCLDEQEYARYLHLIRERAAARAAEMEEILTDPVLSYLYRTRHEQIAAALRMLKPAPQLGSERMTFRDALRKVQASWNHGSRPEIISTNKFKDESQPTVTAGAMTFRGRVMARRTDIELNRIERQAQDGTFQPLQAFTPEFIAAVIQRRLDYGLTQKQFAGAICRKAAEIKAFEEGKLLYSTAFQAIINVWLNNHPAAEASDTAPLSE